MLKYTPHKNARGLQTERRSGRGTPGSDRGESAPHRVRTDPARRRTDRTASNLSNTRVPAPAGAEDRTLAQCREHEENMDAETARPTFRQHLWTSTHRRFATGLAQPECTGRLDRQSNRRPRSNNARKQNRAPGPGYLQLDHHRSPRGPDGTRAGNGDRVTQSAFTGTQKSENAGATHETTRPNVADNARHDERAAQAPASTTPSRRDFTPRSSRNPVAEPPCRTGEPRACRGTPHPENDPRRERETRGIRTQKNQSRTPRSVDDDTRKAEPATEAEPDGNRHAVNQPDGPNRNERNRNRMRNAATELKPDMDPRTGTPTRGTTAQCTDQRKLRPAQKGATRPTNGIGEQSAALPDSRAHVVRSPRSEDPANDMHQHPRHPGRGGNHHREPAPSPASLTCQRAPPEPLPDETRQSASREHRPVPRSSDYDYGEELSLGLRSGRNRQSPPYRRPQEHHQLNRIPPQRHRAPDQPPTRSSARQPHRAHSCSRSASLRRY